MSTTLKHMASLVCTNITSGTRARFTTADLRSSLVVLSAPPGNTGNILVGDSNVSTTRQMVCLAPGDSFVLDLSEQKKQFALNEFYADAATTNDDATLTYFEQ